MPLPAIKRRKEIAFVGNAADYHPWRRLLIDALKSDGAPLAAGSAPREVAARLYAEALLGFNSSLNGDLNLRIFEVLSGGACLLTDRLAPQSGLSLILDEDRHFVGYADPEELVQKARFYLAHPEAAQAIGAAGAARYAAEMTPGRQRDRLLDWVLGGRIDPLFGTGWDGRPALAAHEGVALGRRIDLYETLQEAHRTRRRLRVLFGPGVAASHIADAADLTRADLAVLTPDGLPPPSLDLARSCAAGKPVTTLTPDQAGRRIWDVVVAAGGTAAFDPHLFPGATILTV
jgi:hypothetical protein